MLKYTIAFLKRGDEILLLNREKPYWMGCWNGVGGKLLPNETPLDCVLREIKEETGIKLETIHYKGTVTWNVGSFDGGGMYLYLADLPADFSYSTPAKTDEGILDWKKIDWILDTENQGIANLHYFFPAMLHDNQTYEHRFIYEGDLVKSFTSIPRNLEVCHSNQVPVK